MTEKWLVGGKCEPLAGSGQKVSGWRDAMEEFAQAESHHLRSYRPADLASMIRRIRRENYTHILLRSGPIVVLLAPLLSLERLRGTTLILDIPTPRWTLKRENRMTRGLTPGHWAVAGLNRVEAPWLWWIAQLCITYAPDRFPYTLGMHSRTIRLVNGFNARRIPLSSSPTHARPLTLLGVGHLSRWHGYDRVIEGLAKASNPERFRFVVCGDGPAAESLERQVASASLGQVVTFLGFQNQTALAKWANQSHLGVGSLGLHRTGLESATPLKNREFLARGLPLIQSGDPGLSEHPASFEVPSDDSAVDMDAVLKDYENRLRQLPRRETRQWALENASITSQVVLLRKRLGLSTTTLLAPEAVVPQTVDLRDQTGPEAAQPGQRVDRLGSQVTPTK